VPTADFHSTHIDNGAALSKLAAHKLEGVRDLNNVFNARSGTQCLKLGPPALAANGANDSSFRSLDNVRLIATFLDSIDYVIDLFGVSES
jgi:hypothetical protein